MAYVRNSINRFKMTILFMEVSLSSRKWRVERALKKVTAVRNTKTSLTWLLSNVSNKIGQTTCSTKNNTFVSSSWKIKEIVSTI